MGKREEELLEIKEFPGIDRSSDGTVTPPNRFEVLQNMHPYGAGELRKISGVIDESGLGLPGVGKIISQRFMKDALGNTLLMAFYRPGSLGNWDPNVSSSNFSATGSSYKVDSFVVVYVGPGGAVRNKSVDMSSPGTATTMTFTVPNDVPDFVGQIDIYGNPFKSDNSTEQSSTDYVRFASLHRKANGTFPSSVTFSVRGCASDAPPTANISGIPPYVIRSNATSGTTQRLYFGVAPFWFDTTNKPIVRLTDIANNVLAADVDLNNDTTVTMVFPWTTASSDMAIKMSVAGFSILSMLPFCGITPEDLLLCARSSSSDPGAGCSTFVDLDLKDFTISAIDATNDTVTLTAVTGSVADLNNGDVLGFNSNSGSTNGLTSGNVYWIRKLSSNIVQLYSSFDNYSNNIPMDITGSITGSPKLKGYQLNFKVNVTDLRNNRNNVFMCSRTNAVVGTYHETFQYERNLTSPYSLSAEDLRVDGTFQNNSITGFSVLSVGGLHDRFNFGIAVISTKSSSSYPAVIDETAIVGCWVIRQFPFSLANAHQLLPGINERTLSQTSIKFLGNESGRAGFGVFWNPVQNNPEKNSEAVSCSQFRNRLFTANGDNLLWYTNGYVWKATMRNNGGQQVPQSRYVQAFADKLIAGGGKEAIQNSNNVFYYSDTEDPFGWGTTSVNSNAVFSAAPINGLGVYSQNLLNSGFAHFLLISKEDSLFVWQGNTDSGPQQLYYSFGFAGPRAFAITDYGPILASRSNLFFVQGQNITEVGNEVKDILRGLTDTQLYRVQMTYQNRVLKIGYPSGAGSDPDCDREIWLEFRTEEGQLQKYVSGPHVMTPYYDMDSALSFNGSRDVRVSSKDNKPYLRDSGLDDNGSNIPVQIVLSRMGLSRDLLRKILTEFDVAVKLGGDETLSIQLDAEDGSTTFTDSKSAQTSIATRYLFQYLMTERFLGRVNKLTLSASSKNALSIFNLTARYRTQKRTTMRF